MSLSRQLAESFRTKTTLAAATCSAKPSLAVRYTMANKMTNALRLLMPADLRRPLPDFRDARAVAIAIASIKYYRISRRVLHRYLVVPPCRPCPRLFLPSPSLSPGSKSNQAPSRPSLAPPWHLASFGNPSSSAHSGFLSSSGFGYLYLLYGSRIHE